MGERKVLNKYYPPDFDPEKLPRNRRPKGQQVVVRVMLPFSVQCQTCGEYVYRGKKFNARKEEVIGGDYLGIRVWRFYIKCTNCVSEITFRTDPKNADYVCEAGAARNFEPWRQDRVAEAELKKEKADEEADAIKALENRTAQSKREMERLDELEELKDINERQANLDYSKIIEARRAQEAAGNTELNEDGLAKEDLELLESVDFSRRLKDDDDYNDQNEDDIDPDWNFGHNPSSSAPPNAVAAGSEAASVASSASASTAVSSSPAASLLSSTPSALAPAAPSGLSGLIVVKKRKPEDRSDKEKSKEKKKHKKKSKDKEAESKPAAPSASLNTAAASPAASKPAPAPAAPSGLASLVAYDDDSDS